MIDQIEIIGDGHDQYLNNYNYNDYIKKSKNTIISQQSKPRVPTIVVNTKIDYHKLRLIINTDDITIDHNTLCPIMKNNCNACYHIATTKAFWLGFTLFGIPF